MPRNASGVYTLPAGNPVVTGTIITSTWANATMPDIGTELTSSLDRSGRGSMLAPFKATDGLVGAPGMTFGNEPTSGLWRSGAGVLNLSILAASIGSFQSTGWNGSVVGHASLDLPLTGGTVGGLNVTGAIPATSSATGGVAIGMAATFPQLQFINNGGAADTKIWDQFIDNAGAAHFRVVNDAQGAASDWLTLTRTALTRVDGNYALGWLGVGIQPNALWTNTIFRGIELGPNTTTGAGFAVFGQGATAAGYLATNTYYDGANFRNKAATYASTLLRMFNDGTNAFLFQTAPVGAANAVTAFIDVMSILNDGTIRDKNALELGYKVMPTGTVTSGVLTTAERGRCVDMTAGVTIPNAVFAAGDSFALFNTSLGSFTITQGAGLTLRLAGTALTGNRALAQIGLATVRFFSSSVAVISGAGVS